MGEMRDMGRYSMLPQEEKEGWEGDKRLEKGGEEGGGGDDIVAIKIKTLDNDRELDVDADGSWTIQQLKHHLKDKYELHGKRIRLIRLGKMLEDANTVSSYGLEEGDCVHAAIVDEPPAEHRVDVPGGGGGGGERAGEEEDESAGRGFDTLVHTGFTTHEIGFLRAQFHTRRGMDPATMPVEEMISYEEEWLRSQREEDDAIMGSAHSFSGRLDRRLSRARLAEDGTQADFVLGVVMGFVFGVIMFFWVWDRGITRQQKMGILCGIGFNLMMGMMRIQSRHHPGYGPVVDKRGQRHASGEWHGEDRDGGGGGGGYGARGRQQHLLEGDGGLRDHAQVHRGLQSPLGTSWGGK